jgi:glutathione S-transferase
VLRTGEIQDPFAAGITRYPRFSGDNPAWKRFDEFLKARLGHVEPVLAGREWLAGSFSVADILMADVLRLVDRFDQLTAHPACREYVARATARPSFVKARANQMAHFAAADRTRAKS